MKKETVNSFQGGMNKDLNALVTPNDVLTDALNAQILTFNGDELSLQTDSGNTKIKVGNDFVKLSDGFYPLGIKEYGGVLYIVSGKKEEGEEDLIEFGSYPAPEFGSDRSMPGIGANITENELYKTYIINNNYFKTGSRIRFSTTSDSVFNNVTSYASGLNLINRIYHAELLHQLENGVLNLTNDIWEKFMDHKNKTSDPATHWLSSETFLYYCPTQYKGKLQLRVILDEPEYFKLSKAPTIIDFADITNQNPLNPDNKSDIGDNYPLALEFVLEKNDSQHIAINKYNIKITYSDGTTDEWSNLSGLQNVIKIPYKDQYYESHPYIDYEIIPQFSLISDGSDLTILPAEFRNKYKIKGTKLLEARFREIYFSLLDPICSGNEYMHYTKAILRDRNSNLDNNLEPTEDEYGFIHDNSDSTNINLFGKYKIDGTKIKITETYPLSEDLDKVRPGLYNHLTTMLEQTDGEMVNSDCDKYTIYFRFNLAFGLSSPNQVNDTNYSLSFSQPSVSIEPMPYVTTDGGRTFKLEVHRLEDIHVLFDFRGTVGNYVLKQDNILSEYVYNLGITTNLLERRVLSNQQSGREPNNSDTVIVTIIGGMIIGGNVNSFYYESVGEQNEYILDYIYNEDLFQIEKKESVSQSMSIDYEKSMSRFKIVIDPEIKYTSLPKNGKISYPFEVVNNSNSYSDFQLTETTYLNMENFENHVRLGREDIGYIIVKKEDSCWIDKVDNSENYSGSTQPGRSSGSHRGSSQRQ